MFIVDCHKGTLFSFLRINIKISQITKSRLTKGAISRPTTAIKLATGMGIFNQEKNKKAVVRI